jgi:hypothetical protein
VLFEHPIACDPLMKRLVNVGGRLVECPASDWKALGVEA